MNKLGDMSAAEFRRFGMNRSIGSPITSAIEPGDSKAQLPPTPPEHGEPMEQIIADVDRLIVPALTHWSHLSFFAYSPRQLPGLASWVSC